MLLFLNTLFFWLYTSDISLDIWMMSSSEVNENNFSASVWRELSGIASTEIFSICKASGISLSAPESETLSHSASSTSFVYLLNLSISSSAILFAALFPSSSPLPIESFENLLLSSSGLSTFVITSIRAVSYTHLDVYKRQVLYWT